jgi:hypothetical protein
MLSVPLFVSAANFNQIGLDDQCYTISTYTIPELHKLHKTITLCHNSTPLFNAVPQLTSMKQYTCPDTNVEVVVFAPNKYSIELNVSMDVYNTAISLNYTTALLLVENATTDNFLSYARCSQLVALFYDGDADPEAITSYDGLIYYTDISQLEWNYQVISYWVACEAYNYPMLSAVVSASPRRWASGISDLLVGPSDIAAAAAMKSALNGSLLEESFNKAIKQWDDPVDFWGFGGFGSD